MNETQHKMPMTIKFKTVLTNANIIASYFWTLKEYIINIKHTHC